MKYVIVAAKLAAVLGLLTLGFLLLGDSAISPRGWLQVSGDELWTILKSSVVFPFVVSLMTLLGIISKSVYDQLSTKEGEVDIYGVVKASTSTADFWKSVIVSPIVIFAVYQNLHHGEAMLAAAVLSYQNGFFFRHILESKQPS